MMEINKDKRQQSDSQQLIKVDVPKDYKLTR